jgi:Ca-activated chloride channel family protein
LKTGQPLEWDLATAVNRLKDSDAKSKVIILLTDGVNNRGSIDPITAAQIAANFGIRVYTVGVGKNGFAPYPVQTMFGIQYQNQEVEIDEATLKQISEITEGKYFRATNNQKLINIYKEIDKLEKSKVEVKKFSSKNDEFLPLAIIVLLALIFDVIIRNTVLRTIP